MVGFAEIGKYIPDPFRELTTAISIGVCLSEVIVNQLIHGPTSEYAYHYHVVNMLLNEIALKTTNLIQIQGYKALPIPASQTVDKKKLSALLSHKTAATRSGLGWIGKNGLLITPKFGPRIRLVTVLTEYPFEKGNPIEDDQCGDCLQCINICPVSAIKGNHWTPNTNRNDILDVFACNRIIEKNKKIFNAPICGQCIRACPVGE